MFIRIFVLGLLSMLSLAVHAQTLEQQLTALEKISAEIPKKQTIHNASQTNEVKRKVISVREDALSQQKIYEADIEKNRILLETLTIEDETVTTEKDKTLAAQRRAIEAELAKSTAQLKKTRLIEAQAKKLLSQISALNANTFTDFIFKQLPLPWHAANLTAAKSEWQAVAQAPESSLRAGLLALLFGVVAIVGFIRYWAAPQLLSQYQLTGMNLRQPWLLAGFVTILGLALVLYMYLGTEERSPHAVGALLFIAYIAAAPMLWVLLGRLPLQPQEKSSEDDLTPPKQYHLLRLLRSVSRVILVMVPVMLLLGYVILGAYLTFNIAVTVAAIGLFFVLRAMVEQVVSRLFSENESMGGWRMMPLFVAELAIGGVLFLIVSTVWGFATQNYSDMYTSYKNGVAIGNTQFNLQTVLFALVGFFAVLWLFKFIQWFFKERIFKYTNTKRSMAEASHSLLGYVGIAAAIITSLSILGLEVEDLALVVGALSLGIGFGLQNVINNFVSGLILLFERPVKIGDWVVLDNGVEGHIRRIRIRSTELETFSRASVVIPNSDLISKSITNWTLHDPIGRIEIPIGVAYGSDTKLVKKLLDEISQSHPGIRKTPAPKVLFVNFGDSSLDFSMRCFLRNVDEKMTIESELRFAIDDAFREHNIEIPFPQRDIHIKSGSLS